MAAKLGSFRHSFAERKQRLLSQKGDYGNFEYANLRGSDEETKCQCWHSFRNSITNSWKGFKDFFVKGREMGRSDPRKVIFSAKIGLALVIITILLYFNIPSKALDQQYIWAIITVVVVFEFSIGATFNRGFCRGLGTFSAGALALAVAEVSIWSRRWEEVVILTSIFITGSVATFIKLYPTMKNYEYGFRVFVLTYCFILVSGEKIQEFIRTAVSRLLLILLGAGVGLAVNICIYPIWTGEDLHKLVVKNFDSVATSLEGCVNGYLHCVEYERIPSMILSYQTADGPLHKAYMSAVESKTQEETLESYAVWEPPHGRYKMFNYPWKNYVKVSTALRHCAFTVMALHGSLLSEIQAPPERRQVFSRELQRVGNEGAKVLRELGEKVKNMEKLKQGEDILLQVHEAAEELQLKIDQKSYLLVNSESWVIGRRPMDTDSPENAKDNEKSSFLFKSQSETVLNLRSDALPNNWYHQNPEIAPIAEESKAYESASALSLATFASLLVEFVARLQNLVEAFQELSEVAKFKVPVVEIMAEQGKGGFSSKVLKWLCFKN